MRCTVFAVAGVADALDDGDDHGGVHGVGDDQALADLAAVGALFGCRRFLGHQAFSSSSSEACRPRPPPPACPRPRRPRPRRPRRPWRPRPWRPRCPRPHRPRPGPRPAARRRWCGCARGPRPRSAAGRPPGGRDVGLGQTLGLGDLAGPEHGQHPGDVLLDVPQLREVVELAGGQLEAEVEQLLARLVEAGLELVVVVAREISAAVAIRPAPPGSRGCRAGRRSGP